LNGEASPIARREWLALGGLLLIAAVLRVWDVSALGVDHFDEGVYAFSALGLTDGDQPRTFFPDQLLFSPPVHLSLVGLAYLLAGGASAAAAVAAAIATGTATVAVLWGFLRRTFGPAVALAAAVLLTFDTYHIGLCRTGLTDTTFALFFVLAVWTICAALERGGIGRALLAGLAVGLAWNTKYHGWFAAMTCGAALLCWWFRGRTERTPLKPTLVSFGVICATAIASYLPWALFVQTTHGYRKLMHYQRGMLREGYLENLQIQAENLTFLSGPLDVAALGLAAAAVILLQRRGSQSLWRIVGVILPIILIGAFAGAPAARLALALGSVVLILARPAPLRAWVLLGWTGVFFFSAPLYHPYARLLLPLQLAMSGLAAHALDALVTRASETVDTPDAANARPGRVAWVTGGAAVLLAVAGFELIQRSDQHSDPWRPATGSRVAAEEIAELIPVGARTVVLGEPTVGFQLHLLGRPAFERVLAPDRDLANTTEPTYVVAGRYARSAPQLRDGLARLGARLEFLADVQHPLPKDHRLLDDLMTAKRVRQFLNTPTDLFHLSVYRLDPIEPDNAR
jgi:4-amino-4-deoxy-L-arabinose transferase-like glycosyltransferase